MPTGEGREMLLQSQDGVALCLEGVAPSPLMGGQSAEEAFGASHASPAPFSPLPLDVIL